MNEKYIRYLPKFSTSLEFEEAYSDSEILKEIKDFQPYISVNQEKFPDFEEKEKPLKKVERKLNIRVRQDDIYLLDSIAKYYEMSRSELIDDMLYRFLLEELKNIKDKDAQALLAVTVDQQVSYNELDRPWVYDVLENEFEDVLINMLDGNQAFPTPERNNSALFNALTKKIQGLEK